MSEQRTCPCLRLRARALVLALASALACGDADPEANEKAVSAGAAAAATAPAGMEANVRVRVRAVSTGIVAGRDEVQGIVHAFHKATVTAETSGRVVERLVEPGDPVEQDSPLFQLDASRPQLELERASATVTSRKTDLEHARREHERGQQLVASDAISEQHRDDLQHGLDHARVELQLARVARDTAQRNLRDATIGAPFAGAVEETLVDIGDFVQPGVPVAQLVQLARVRLRAGVTAEQAAQLEVGMLAQAVFRQVGGVALPAELRSIGLVADPASGTYDVEFWLDNPGGRLREGMVANIALPDSKRAPHPRVPREALLRRDGGMAVFIVEAGALGAHARARSVRIGRSDEDWIEVLAGLDEGERVVIDGHFALRDGSGVTVDAANLDAQ